MLGVSLITGLTSNLCTDLPTQNSTESNCIISYAKNRLPFQSTVFLVGIYQWTCHRERMVCFLQHKPLLRSSANSTVTACTNIKTYTPTHTCVRVHALSYTYIYIHTYTHLYRYTHIYIYSISGVPRNFVGGFNKFSWGQRTENGDLGAVAPYPLAKGSGGSCNLVQEISFCIVKVS